MILSAGYTDGLFFKPSNTLHERSISLLYTDVIYGKAYSRCFYFYTL